jgi:very-short-patch-repair endonuclease
MSVDAALASVIEARGWTPGNRGENRVARILHGFGFRPGAELRQQFRIGAYRLDFAWPAIRIAIEADGWVHRADATYARDRERDAWLRARGWLIFRVDVDAGDGLGEQLARVARVVRWELGQ